MQHSEIIGLLKYPWIVLGLVWLITWFIVKRTTRGEASWVSLLRSLFFGLLFDVLYRRPPRWHWLHAQLLPTTVTTAWIGLGLTIVGAAFGIWARFTLGRNWSSRAKIKNDHQLIVTGPYRIVRNPIYTGVLLALLGTAVALGQMRHFVGLPVLLGLWIWKTTTEQKLLRDQFGEAYEDYCRRVKAFIPYVV